MNRLTHLLEPNQILVDGKIAPVKHNIPFDDNKSISLIIEYLISSKN